MEGSYKSASELLHKNSILLTLRKENVKSVCIRAFWRFYGLEARGLCVTSFSQKTIAWHPWIRKGEEITLSGEETRLGKGEE